MTQEKRGRGRPKKTKYNITTMCQAISKYVDRNKKGIPILKECCLENDWHYDYVMQLQRDNEDLSQSIKKLHYQREVNLEKGALTGQFNNTMAIFILKQPVHGWTDKHQVSIDTEEKLIQETKDHLKAIREGAVEADS